MSSSVNSRAVIVMGRIPRAGEVKTRLTKVWTPQEAAQLYEAFLRDVFELVDRAYELVRFRRVFCCVFFEDTDPICAQSLVGPQWEIMQQGEGDLGARIETARSAAESEYVVVLGSDAPQMAPERLENAFRALEERGRDVVLGPTEDGGYDLIGFNGRKTEVLRDISWSSSQVISQTRERARASGFDLEELELGYDIDEPEDLQRVLVSTQGLTSSCIYTKEAVRLLTCT